RCIQKKSHFSWVWSRLLWAKCDRIVGVRGRARRIGTCRLTSSIAVLRLQRSSTGHGRTACVAVRAATCMSSRHPAEPIGYFMRLPDRSLSGRIRYFLVEFEHYALPAHSSSSLVVAAHELDARYVRA